MIETKDGGNDQKTGTSAISGPLQVFLAFSSPEHNCVWLNRTPAKTNDDHTGDSPDLIVNGVTTNRANCLITFNNKCFLIIVSYYRVRLCISV